MAPIARDLMKLGLRLEGQQIATTSTMTLPSLSTSGAPDSKRMGGFNGAVAQGAALIIGGFSGGQLNGPTGGGYRMPIGGSAPISRPYK